MMATLGVSLALESKGNSKLARESILPIPDTAWLRIQAYQIALQEKCPVPQHLNPEDTEGLVTVVMAK